jgi:hypothetical protein
MRYHPLFLRAKMTHDMDADRMPLRTMRRSIAPQTPGAFTIHAMGVRLRLPTSWARAKVVTSFDGQRPADLRATRQRGGAIPR